MNKTRNADLTTISQTLRKSMTKEERHLWYDFLKQIPQTVQRQKVIGNYVVDFYCANAKLVIELDGFQHYTDDGVKHDVQRDAYLRAQGIRVLRYSNLDVTRNFAGVCADIMQHLDSGFEEK